MDESSLQEAEAFDRHARERAQHNHIPDLRQAQPCDWFYNNPWRRPYLVDMVFGRYFRFALSHLTGQTLLEVGSGVGHMSLEFARHGYHVTGIDLSGDAIETARQVAKQNPFLENWGALDYVMTDFTTWRPPQTFDNICFFGTLHHFDAVESVLSRVNTMLNSGGRLVIVEPARDWHNLQDAAIIGLIRRLLAAQGCWYEQLPLPSSLTDLEDYVHECLREYQQARDRAESFQSPHDNAASGTAMLAVIRRQFEEIAFEPSFSFFPRMGGGIRGESEETVKQMAQFLYLFDSYAVATGLMNPGGFLWAGRKL